jgi:hypothetical protein
MKTTVFLIIAMCFLTSLMLKAQFTKGRSLLGLSTSSNLLNFYEDYSGGTSNLMHIGFSTWKYSSKYLPDNSEKVRSFNISPRGGLFIANNLAAGLDLNYAFEGRGTGDNKESTSAMGIGPFLRYYISGKKIVPFFEAAASFGSIKNKYNSYVGNANISKDNVISYFAGVGLSIPIGDIVKFDLLGGYVSTTVKSSEANLDDYKTVLQTLGINLGFFLYLGKKGEN